MSALRSLVILGAMLAALPASALAGSPTISAISQQDRHPSITFAAPRASSVTVYLATKPDRATDGSFLTENVASVESLTDDEIAQGHWLDASQLTPGFYYVMVRASEDSSCLGYDAAADAVSHDPACANGYSSMVGLSVPTPPTAYSVKATMLRAIRLVDLVFTGTPLGKDVPYQLCWNRRKSRAARLTKRCENGTLDGYSWDDRASDDLTISTIGMARRTTFTWSTRGPRPLVLLTKTIRVR